MYPITCQSIQSDWEIVDDEKALKTKRIIGKNKEIDIKIVDIDTDCVNTDAAELLAYKPKKEVYVRKKMYLDENGKEIHDKSKQI